MKIVKRGDITFAEADYSEGVAWEWALILAFVVGATVLIAAHFNLHII